MTTKPHPSRPQAELGDVTTPPVNQGFASGTTPPPADNGSVFVKKKKTGDVVLMTANRLVKKLAELTPEQAYWVVEYLRMSFKKPKEPTP